MKLSQRLCAGFAVFTCLLAGCVTDNSMRLRVSGTPGAAFTARYHVRSMQGEVSTAVPSDGAGDVLEVSGKDFGCDISKADRSADLTAELVARRKPLFRAQAPTGTQGVRISRDKAGWRQETY
jgi:hypothetical protein